VAGPATTPANTQRSSPPTVGRGPQTFDTALRGYDRRQVDEFVAERSKEIAQLKAELGEAQRQCRMATEHAQATEREIRDLKVRSAHIEPAAPEDSFGFRAEKLLRMAEHEAVEIRTHAGRESAAIIEKARTDAEKHRHEVEQSLIGRASMLEQQAAQRATELQDREQQIADQLNSAREQADQVHAAAARAAERLRQESEASAAEVRAQAEAEVRRRRDQAAQEIARLSSLQSDVRAELARLAEMLSAELSDTRIAVPHLASRPDRTAAPAGKPAAQNAKSSSGG
jgi:chromosome segregation ATPase